MVDYGMKVFLMRTKITYRQKEHWMGKEDISLRHVVDIL